MIPAARSPAEARAATGKKEAVPGIGTACARVVVLLGVLLRAWQGPRGGGRALPAAAEKCMENAIGRMLV
jgi:hypothetical protein